MKCFYNHHISSLITRFLKKNPSKIQFDIFILQDQINSTNSKSPFCFKTSGNRSVMLNHLFILALLTPIVFCRSSVNDRQWIDSDNRENCTKWCTEDCEHCKPPNVCDVETQVTCDCVPQEHLAFDLVINCPCNEQCIPKGCECKYILLLLTCQCQFLIMLSQIFASKFNILKFCLPCFGRCN